MLLWLSLAMALFGGGCDDEGGLSGQPLPNTPPETEITALPLAPDRTHYEATFHWRGYDKDDEIVGFEWRLSSNGADGVVDPADTLEAVLPWRFTTRTDSTFCVSADLDSFNIDLSDSTLDGYGIRYWQTHTLFLRAVDSRGRRDPTPAHASFTATTLAPTVYIDFPRLSASITCNGVSRVLTFGWTGHDPDSYLEKPTHARYLLIPFDRPDGGCYTRTEYEQLQPIRNDDPGWSRWFSYDAPQDSGRTVRFPRKELGRRFLFAVQVKDEAGAVTPVFEWARNVRHVETRDNMSPLLYCAEAHLGPRAVVGTDNLRSEEIVGGQPVEFSWGAKAEEYGCTVVGYRYGWNLVDPEDPDDPGWAVPWGPNWKRAPTRSFPDGTPNFVLQARDNAGNLSRIMYQLQVIPEIERASQRNLLLVDDWPFGDSFEERTVELSWDRKWEGLLDGRVSGFVNQDVVDAQDGWDRLGFGLVNQYKSVIWFVGPSTLTYMRNVLAPSHYTVFWEGRRYTFRRVNWLEIYMRRIGNVLLVGPSSVMSTVGAISSWIYPLIYDVPNGFPLGFGVRSLPDGTTGNGGTTRFPYTAYCLEATDIIRPAPAMIYGEPTGITKRKRMLECDGLVEARVSPYFIEEYPDAIGYVRDLTPAQARLDQDGWYRFQFEEFYNVNVTGRDVSLNLRDCQIPMYVHRARRDEGIIADPESECYPLGREISILDGVPVAIVSNAYSDTKQLRGAEDFCWGFHPLAFEPHDVQRALLWILGSRWEIPVR